MFLGYDPSADGRWVVRGKTKIHHGDTEARRRAKTNGVEWGKRGDKPGVKWGDMGCDWGGMG